VNVAEATASVAMVRPRRRRRGRLLPYALIAPIAILLLAISVYPGLYAIWLAMTDASLLRLARAQFIGIGNFVRMAGDDIFLDSLWRTLRWDVAVVLSELLIALPIALFLNLTFRGRGFARVAMMIPYITPPAVVGLLFAYMFDGNFGVVNDILVKAGILDRYVSFLSDPDRKLRGDGGGDGLVRNSAHGADPPGRPANHSAAAVRRGNVDGASAWQRFRYITLPHLMPSILFLMLLRLIWMSNHIDMIFVLTQGGPGFANYTAAVYSFKLTNQFEIGYASAVAVVLTILLVAASAMYVRHLARKVLVAA
jgi:multiple sugar transport system permease protein